MYFYIFYAVFSVLCRLNLINSQGNMQHFSNLEFLYFSKYYFLTISKGSLDFDKNEVCFACLNRK